MIQRELQQRLITALRKNASVALTGPRQVGKTTIALNIADSKPSVYLDLESSADREKVKDVAAFYAANSDKLIILDEMQRLPELFPDVRGIIDRQRRKGNKSGLFLFLGSASMELLKQSSESLAGRIAYLELYPVDALEYAAHSLEKLQSLWLRGGFPESLLAASEHDSLQWRRDFIRTYLERDIPQLGPRIPAETLERFWTMLAYNQGTVLNNANLARALEVSATTVNRYLDLMVDLLLVRRLSPWTFNIGKRLIRSPKIYVRDSGMTHALLGIGDYNTLLGHPVVGGSWEGFVIENISSVAGPQVKTYYYGTPGGAEIDLLLEVGYNELWAIEIKRSTAPVLSKGFYSACDDVKPKRKFVVYTGETRFPMAKDIEAMPLTEIMHEVKRIG
jgi:uncharacterized protein